MLLGSEGGTISYFMYPTVLALNAREYLYYCIPQNQTPSPVANLRNTIKIRAY